jgi:hypothetical protein
VQIEGLARRCKPCVQRRRFPSFAAAPVLLLRR